ncbi:hypothetical protein M1N79_04350 [Dehalococcoidia bacterium]|nr:hypothetical protein [Dehalococcoidia bacterium]
MLEIDEYLRGIGITSETLKSRVELARNLASQIFPEEIEEIFVSDYIKDDGSREHESVWFFSKSYCAEAPNFVSEHGIDIVPIKTKRLEVNLRDYDFTKATEKSRFQLLVLLEEGLLADLKASKDNCNHLKHITIKYFRSRLAE